VQDPVRDVLRWLNDAEACRRGMTPQAWDAFRNVARAQFGVDVERDATADAAARVIKSDPKWETVVDEILRVAHHAPRFPQAAAWGGGGTGRARP
jgi:hypothetical protein